MGAALAGRYWPVATKSCLEPLAGKATDVVKAGAVEAGSLAEAVKAAEVVLTCLSNDAACARRPGDGGVRAPLPMACPTSSVRPFRLS